MRRAHRFAAVPYLAMATFLLAPFEATSAEGGRELPTGAVSCEVTVDPPVVAPGETVVLTCRIAGTAVDAAGFEELEAVAGFGTAEAVSLTFGADDGDWIGSATLPTQAWSGTQLATVRGRTKTLAINGHASVWTTGGSSPTTVGSALNVQGEVRPGHGAGTRYMQHPRDMARFDDAIVSCNTDSLGAIDLTASSCPWQEPTDVSFEQSQLLACEHMALDVERRLIVATTRGDSGHPGGLTTWSVIKRSDGPPDFAHLDTFIDEAGFEGLEMLGSVAVVARRVPRGLGYFQIADDGAIEHIVDLQLPVLFSPWAVDSGPDGTVYLTDVGEHTHDDPSEVGHDHGAGHLAIITQKATGEVVLSGLYETVGPAKALTVMDDDVVALAQGVHGIELVDVSIPHEPRHLAQIDTWGSVVSLDYEDGLLAVADWFAFRLYDASERGVLRPVDALDMVPREYAGAGEDLGCNNEGQVDGVQYAGLEAGGFAVGDMDRMYVGQIDRSRRTPRAVAHDSQRFVAPSVLASPTEYLLRYDNGGSLPLTLAIEESAGVTDTGGPITLEPGEGGFLSFLAAAPEDGPEDLPVRVRSNEPGLPRHEHRLTRAEGLFAPGDPAPWFRLPALECAGGACSVGECVDADGPTLAGRPIVLLYFGSW